jgi:hypothetical protein
MTDTTDAIDNIPAPAPTTDTPTTPAPQQNEPLPLAALDIKPLAEACSQAYGAFLASVRALPVGDIYKQMGFQMLDTGWLWIKEGITQNLNDALRNTVPTAQTVQ